MADAPDSPPKAGPPPAEKSGAETKTISRSGEMADALDSKSSGGNTVWVRLPPPALTFQRNGTAPGWGTAPPSYNPFPCSTIIVPVMRS